jgi:ketosteroid isomerase-like protein
LAENKGLEGLDEAIEQSHRALVEIANGNAEPFRALYSQRDDVTLGNPFGPFARGPTEVAETLARAAANYRDGRARDFERIAKYETADLAYIVEVERYEAKVGGSSGPSQVSLRVTSIFRRENGSWRLVHRHADPITGPRPAESVIEK